MKIFNKILKSPSYKNLLYLSVLGYYFYYNTKSRVQVSQCLTPYLKSNLLEFDKKQVSMNKSSRVFILSSPHTSSPNEKNENLIQNLKKLYTRYPNLQSYHVNMKDNKEMEQFAEFLKELSFNEDLNKSIYEIKENLSKKSIFFVNKYGDVKVVDEMELEELTKEDSSFNFFEKFTILNNKNSLLELSSHSFVFFAYLNSSKLNEDNYTVPAFRIFRKIFFNLSFFNIKFFVGTNEFTNEIKELELTSKDYNSLFLIKRCEIGKVNNHDSSRIFEINNERFELIKLVDNNENIDKDDNKLLHNIWKKIIDKTAFYFYMKNNIDSKHANEFLNLFFKEEPYYIMMLNLKDKEHKKVFTRFFNSIRKLSSEEMVNTVVFDSENNEKMKLVKTFKEKKLMLDKSTMKNTMFKETISHHSKYVLKKLVLEDSLLNEQNIEKMIKTKDISFEENYLHAKPLENKDFKLVNIENYDYLLANNTNINKIVLIQSTDNLRNRNVREKIEEIIKGNEINYKFFYMNGTAENKSFLENKLKLKFENFPQMLVVSETGAFLLPVDKFLKYSVDSSKLKKEINIFCEKLNKNL